MDNPLLGFLVTTLAGGNASEAIVQSEKDGTRREMVSERLPTDNEYRAAWEALGVSYFEVIANDPLWTAATLPEGWTKQPTDHHMYTALVDEHGNERGKYFFKAAYYDCRAHMGSPKTRYTIASDYDIIDSDRRRGVNSDHMLVKDAQTGAVLFRTSGKIGPDGERRSWSREAWDASGNETKKIRARAVAWLDEHKPEWRDPAAYWGSA